MQKLASEIDLGRYRLIAKLGHGGMAELFLARLIGAAGFEKLVAIKLMLPHLSTDPMFVKMFENEGRIAAQLNHPNVCQVIELGEAEGQLFLAMEFLRGMPWSEIVPVIPEAPLAPFARFIVGVLVQACEGLHYAHTSTDVDGRPRPIVHRDVSPSNLFVTTEGIVKLLDFGISKILTDVTTTQAGALKGKLPYMSPEQLSGVPIDARSDIYAMGAVTWEAFAGRVLFDRVSVLDAFQERTVPRLPGEGPVIDRLDAVIRRALDDDRERRPDSAREYAAELRRAIEPCGDPMTPTEIQAHVEELLGANIARQSRDLAHFVGRPRAAPIARVESESDAETHEQAAREEHGVRVRDASAVVRAATDDAKTLEQSAAETAVETGSTTMTRFPIAPEPPPPTVVQAPRTLELTIKPTSEAAPSRGWLVPAALAVLAIGIGVIAAFWLS